MLFKKNFQNHRKTFIIIGTPILLLLISGCTSKASYLPQNKERNLPETRDNSTLETFSLGINLNGIVNWSTQLPFLDHFKSSKKWLTQCVKSDPGCPKKWDTGEYELLDLDENGWVKSLPSPEESPIYTRVGTVMFRVGGRYPGGKYIVLYEGEGTIKYGFAAKKDRAASRPGRDVIQVTPSKGGGIWLQITATDPNKTGNYIRNIRVIQAEYENLYKSGEIFNPIFIKKIEKFKVFRFMDWLITNNSQQKEWSDIPKIETSSYTLKGAPLEIMVALSNKLKAAPWFNMPHQATDDYLTNFAKTVKESLAPDLKVYVEFSNEVWNWNFRATHYALEQGKARWGQDKTDALWHWYGMRTAQMCNIWKTVFGEQKNRIVCVISTQTAWKGIESKILDCPYWVAEGNKPCYQHGIDAYAIAGYFGSDLGMKENENTIEAWLEEPDGGFKKAIKQLKEGRLIQDSRFDLQNQFELMKYHANIARERELQMVAYEGGQHIAAKKGLKKNKRITNFFIELNRHPEMYDIYTELLHNWRRAGGTLFLHFNDIGKPSLHGSFGALEYVEQEGSPKYNALIDFIDKNP